MNNLHNWIIIIIFVILFGWVVVTKDKYEKLDLEYQELLLNKQFEVDSLYETIHQAEQTNLKLESAVMKLELKLDSLIEIKQDIEKEEFIIEKDLSRSANLLKQNLSCVDLY